MVHSLEQHLADAASDERSASWDRAAQRYRAAFDHCAATRDVAGMLEVLMRMGHAHRQGDHGEAAEEAFLLALAVAELHGDGGMLGRALNGLATLQYEGGRLDEAEEAWNRALELARSTGHEQLLGETQINLGILANIRGDLPAAKTFYTAGLGHAREAANAPMYAVALNNIGMLHVDLGELHAADAYFSEALEVCERMGDVKIAGAVHVNRAELFLARRELDRARESCDQGFEIFSRLGDERQIAEALKFYGIIYRETGKPHLAAIHLRQSIEIAARRDPLLEAESTRELSRVLRAQGRNREALECLNRAHALFSGLRAVPDHADVSEQISQLENEFLSLVQLWGESIEAKDRYTSGHCQRVAAYACRIAEAVGLPEREIVWFRMGAFLHDVGKTEVPEEILNKPGRLTDEERALMERHTVIGDQMLSTVEFPWDVRPMVRSHHERWDGAGYPDGLRGDAIPYAARILRIADVFDALTSTRSYRRSLTHEEAFTMMDEDEGSFDPALFEVFRALLPEMALAAEEAERGGGND